MMVRDPACGMNLDEDKAAATSQHEGRTYYFCSLACKATFEEAPDKYVGTGLQRLAASGFVAEAVLVVDLVESTRLATHYGEHWAMSARNILRDRTLAVAETYGLAFSEHTGDGYLMTFPSVAAAAQTAAGLLRGLRDRPPDLSPGPALAVRVGISYGEILIDARGGRHGAPINKACRVEGLRAEDFVPVKDSVEPGEMPERNRIFLDEDAAEGLAFPLRMVGFFRLKGFSGLHRVYEVRWDLVT